MAEYTWAGESSFIALIFIAKKSFTDFLEAICFKFDITWVTQEVLPVPGIPEMSNKTLNSNEYKTKSGSNANFYRNKIFNNGC